MTPPQNLTQFWRRRPNSAVIYSLQTKLGRDIVDKTLNAANISENIPRFDSFDKDLANFLAGFNEKRRTFEAVRTIENAAFKPDSTSKETSRHLVRLWANEEVKRLLEKNAEAEALDLAVKYQLVTSVSGAVVLETREQYDQFGLKPVEPNAVPTIPEPEEYLLFAVVLAILIWLFRRFRRQRLQSV